MITSHLIGNRLAGTGTQVGVDTPPPSQVWVELRGTDFVLPTTTGYSFDADVYVRVRYANDDGWQIARGHSSWPFISSWSPSSLSLWLLGSHPGYLEFQVCVRTGECSDSHLIEVKPVADTSAVAGAPHIDFFDPDWSVATTAPSSVTMYGSGFAATTTVYARYANQDAWTQSTVGAWVSPRAWLPNLKEVTLAGTRPGYVEFYACNGTACSNHGYFNVKPRFREPARFLDTVYRKAVNTAPTDSDRLLYFRRENVNGDNDSMWIDGAMPWTGGQPSDAWGYTYVPAGVLAAPGVFPIWLRTDAGWSSNYAQLQIWGKPNGTPSPASASTQAATTVQLNYSSEYAAPESTTATISSSSCSGVVVALGYVSPTARSVTIPAACMGGYGDMNVSIATTNYAGTGYATFFRQQVTLTIIGTPIIPRPRPPMF